MRALVAVLACACGGTPAPATTEAPSNRVASPTAKPQRFATMVIEEYSTCTAPHHIVISVDGTTRATIAVTCPEQPVPHNGVIVTDSSPHVVDGPAIEIAPGVHRVTVRDVETGKEMTTEATFPVYGSMLDSRPGKDLPSDVIVVIAHVDWLKFDGSVRANLVIM